MGSTKLWFPSLRSVESHRGGFSIVLVGHCRLGISRGLNLRYFLEGSLSLCTVELTTKLGAEWECEAHIGMMAVVLVVAAGVAVRGLALFCIVPRGTLNGSGMWQRRIEDPKVTRPLILYGRGGMTDIQKFHAELRGTCPSLEPRSAMEKKKYRNRGVHDSMTGSLLETA